MTLKEKLLEKDDTVVITVDIKQCLSNAIYGRAVKNVAFVGEAISRVIRYLIENLRIDQTKITFIGHSMSCHVAGYAGRYLKDHNGILLENIIGIDCAGPLFKNHHDLRIKPSDAKCVISLHTSYTFGLGETLVGDYNIRVNKGGNQPACMEKEKCLDCGAAVISSSACCSHAFGCDIVAEMLTTPEDSNQFLLTHCDNYKSCTIPTDYVLGLSICNKPRGIYDLRTNPSSPYGMGKAGLTNCTSCEECYSCFGSFSQLMAASSDGNVCYGDLDLAES